MQGRWGDELNKSIQETLEAVRLTDKTNAFPPQLSGGMKRRLSIAIALAAKPKVHAQRLQPQACPSLGNTKRAVGCQT